MTVNQYMTKRVMMMKNRMASPRLEKHQYIAMCIGQEVDWDLFHKTYGISVPVHKEMDIYNEGRCFANFVGENSTGSFWAVKTESGHWVGIHRSGSGEIDIQGWINPKYSDPYCGKLGFER